MLFGLLDTSPCLGKPCVAGVVLDPTVQTAGAIVMIAIVLGLAYWGSRKWREGSAASKTMAPA